MPRPAERFLRHDNTDHEGFGATMVACHGFAPNCSYLGACERDGDCFTTDPMWRAVRRIERLANAEDHAGIASGLTRAAVLLARELKGEEPPAESPREQSEPQASAGKDSA